MTIKNVFLFCLIQLISAASISQIKQVDRSLLHPEFMPKNSNSTKINEFHDYYDYDQYYEDYDPTKFTDYYPENYEYYEEDQDLLKIKPKIDTNIPIANSIQPRNKSSTSVKGIDYDYYEGNGEEDYYQLSNSKPVSTTALSTPATASTKSSISILSFLFVNSTSKPVENKPSFPQIINIPEIPQMSNISDNLILKTLFSESRDLFTNNDVNVEKEFKAKENFLIDRLSTTVPAIATTVQTTNLFSEEEYGNYTDMYYYDDFYDLEDYYDDDFFSYNDDSMGHVTEVRTTSTSTNRMPNLNIINVIATVSYNTTNLAPLATETIPTSSKIVTTTQSTISTHTAAFSTPSLYDNFGINRGDLFNNQEYDYYENYFENSDELLDEKEDIQISDSKHPEIKTPLNTTLIGLTIKELLRSPALIAGICGGLLVGVITALVLLFFIIYRMRRNKLDDSPYVVSSKNSPIYGNFKTKGQNVTLMSSSSVSPNTNLSTGSTSSATTGLLNGNALNNSRLLKYANHTTSLKKSCSILSSDSSTSSPNHDGSFNYAYIKAPTKEFYA